MNVYTVIATDRAEVAGAAVAERFPSDNIRLSDNAWLIAGRGTAQEVAGLLGMPTTMGEQSPFSAVVTMVNGYYGFAPNNVWEWIANKQAVPNG